MVRSIFALAAVLSVATASLARDLVTPAVYVGYNTSVECRLLNITSAEVMTHVQVVEVFGPVLVDFAPTPLPGGGALEAKAFYPGTTVFCRFVNASLSKFRGALIEVNTTGDSTETVVVPAQ